MTEKPTGYRVGFWEASQLLFEFGHCALKAPTIGACACDGPASKSTQHKTAHALILAPIPVLIPKKILKTVLENVLGLERLGLVDATIAEDSDGRASCQCQAWRSARESRPARLDGHGGRVTAAAAGSVSSGVLVTARVFPGRAACPGTPGRRVRLGGHAAAICLT